MKKGLLEIALLISFAIIIMKDNKYEASAEEKAIPKEIVVLELGAELDNKPATPIVKVNKISDSEYHLSWEKSEGCYYQIEYTQATYRDNNFYRVLQKYKKDIDSYTARVSPTHYDKIFRVRCYKIIDGVEVLSDYSKPVYSSKPAYPSIYISEFMLDMNSDGGAKSHIQYYHNASKTGEYLTLTITPYITVKDLGSNRASTASFKLEGSGQTIKDRCYELTWDPLFYNWSAEHAIITYAEIVYTDGSSESIKVSKVSMTHDELEANK